MSIKILPYKAGSASVKALKTGLSAMILKLENSTYRQKAVDTIINWGNSRGLDSIRDDVGNVLNSPEYVALASNKLTALQLLRNDGIATVPFTTSKEEAEAWDKVFVRQSLTGHSGEGIEVVYGHPIESDTIEDLDEVLRDFYNSTENESERFLIQEMQALMDRTPLDTGTAISLPDAPLYTKAVTNAGEYRVHVMDSEVILYQKKSRRVDEETGEVETAEGEDAEVRNLASNWVYRTGNLRRLERVEELAISAIRSLGLDFGAVDIIMDENGDVFVLEVNTAPGLKNTETLQAYVNGFNNLIA